MTIIDYGSMDDQEEVYERYQILYLIVFFVILVKYNVILIYLQIF